MKKLTLILLTILMIVTLAACGNKCEHTYDNACDTTCNECGEERTDAHDWQDATCTTPKTCKICATTEGEPLGHTPAEDDGDCTTEVKCTACGIVTTPAGQHTPNDDDGDCTTAITCSVCGTVTTPAKENHTGGTSTCLGYQCDVCGKWYGDKTPENHASEEFAYTVNEDVYTHRKAHKCCDVTVIEAEEHDFVFETGKCKHCDAQAVAELFDYFNSTNVGYYFTMADAFEAIPDDDNLYAVCALADYDADFTIPDNLFTFFGASDRAPAGYSNYVVHSFGGTVINGSNISDGIFNGKVINQSDIIGGTDCIFNCEVINEGTIQGGTFNGEVTNTGTIIIGIFNGCIINNGRISNDRYNGALTLGENFSIVNNGTIDCKYHIYKDGACRLCAYECDHSGTAHTTATDSDDGTHGFTCTVCGGYGTEDHKGGEATCMHGKLCEVCGYEYDTAKVSTNHASDNYTYTDNGDGTHTKTHECGVVVGEPENHTIENHVCTACGAMEIVVSFNAGDHEWKTGDQIKIERTVGYDSDYYTFTASVDENGSTTWTPDKKLYWDGEEEHILAAFYPATGQDDYRSFELPEDQSTLEKLKLADCMNAVWVGNPTTDPINFQMKHRLSMVTVNYEFASEYTNATVDNVEVIPSDPFVMFDAKDGGKMDEPYGLFGSTIDAYHDAENKTIQAIVIPCTYPEGQVFIKISVNGEELQVKMPEAKTLEEGGEYTFDVKVGQDVITIEKVSMGDIDSPFGDGWHNEIDLKVIGTQDAGKTAWENGDQIIVTFTSPRFGTQYGTLTYDASDGSWSTDVSFSYLENETPTVSAIYAPCYEVVDGNMQLKDGMQLGMTEYISAACSITEGTLNISFEGVTRNYSRLRIVGLANQTLTVITTGFTPAGATKEATESYTLTTDENGNADLYGTFAEGATILVKLDETEIAQYVFKDSTTNGMSYALDALSAQE